MIKLASICFFTSVILCSCVGKTDRTGDQTRKKPDAIVNGPANPYAAVDQSPMDMSYFPVNYSQKKMSHDLVTPPVMRVIYSRPQKMGRPIFGELLQYGKPWRLGANEASEIEFFKNVTIQGKKISAGRYVIYCIPEQGRWKIVLNNDIYTWGLKIDSTKDAMTFDIPVGKAPSTIEFFSMVFQPASGGADLVMAWDDIEARLPISF